MAPRVAANSNNTRSSGSHRLSPMRLIKRGKGKKQQATTSPPSSPTATAKQQQTRSVVQSSPPLLRRRRSSLSSSFSLAVGSLTPDGKRISSLVQSPVTTPTNTTNSPSCRKDIIQHLKQPSCSSFSFNSATVAESNSSTSSISSRGKSCVTSSPPSQVIFRRCNSSFLRVADLDLDGSLQSSTSSSSTDDNTGNNNAGNTIAAITGSSDNHPNFSYAAVDPPPGIARDPQELWIALDNGAGSHAPIAPHAIEALARFGENSVYDRDMWTPKNARQVRNTPWVEHTWDMDPTKCQPLHVPPGSTKAQLDDVVLWSGKFSHGLYGSELPAIRATGIINIPPKDLCDLLVDSDRVHEYNKLSLGRQDVLVLQDDMYKQGPFGKSVVKVMKSASSPPLIRTALEFTTLLHARQLDEHRYLLVSRSVTMNNGDDDENDKNASSSTPSALSSEILMGVNLIRAVEGDPSKSVMINVYHIRSPMVPMVIASRIGASAASSFIRDLKVMASS